jgi:hypothetical protein
MKPEEPANPAYVGSRYKNGSFVVQQTLQSGRRKNTANPQLCGGSESAEFFPNGWHEAADAGRNMMVERIKCPAGRIWKQPEPFRPCGAIRLQVDYLRNSQCGH